MSKKISDKTKVGSVQSTRTAAQVEGANAVGGVGQVKAASAVGGVKKAGAVNVERLTRTMSHAEREQIFRMINEEAAKLVEEGGLPASTKEIVSNAVKMAVDSGLVAGGDDSEYDSGKKLPKKN